MQPPADRIAAALAAGASPPTEPVGSPAEVRLPRRRPGADEVAAPVDPIDAIRRALLRCFDDARAEAEFARLLASRQQPDRSEFVRTTYAIARALASAGDVADARFSLEWLAREVPSPEVAAAVAAVLARLAHAEPLEPGKPLPELPPWVDVRGRPAGTQPGPLLIVCFSATHTASMERLAQFARAWQEARLSAQNLIALALESDAVALRELQARQKLPCAVIANQGGFADARWVQLDLHAVPSSLLVAADGLVAARDFAPDRLARWLSAAR